MLTVPGVGATLYGADLLVENAILLARIAGVSDTPIGLTIMAVGTSAPELVTMAYGQGRVGRVGGLGLLAGYVAYVGWLAVNA